MREILFRGKRTDGQWIYGGLLKVTYDGNTYNLIFADNFLFVFGEAKAMEHACVDPATVGQFTGLTDKNGQKIFEGDILKWDSMEWGCGHLEIASWDYELFNMRRNDWEEWCEVIGNVYDNPELLEK